MKTTRLLALMLCSSLLNAMPAQAGSSWREIRGLSPYKRAETLGTKNNESLNRLQGKFVEKPVTVQAKSGTTLVTGNTIINQSHIVTKEEKGAAAMVEVWCPENSGGRIVIRNNRIINRGEILSRGGDAGMTVIQCVPGETVFIETMGNTYENPGRITGTQH
jgi:hypothetical protein